MCSSNTFSSLWDKLRRSKCVTYRLSLTALVYYTDTPSILVSPGFQITNNNPLESKQDSPGFGHEVIAGNSAFRRHIRLPGSRQSLVFAAGDGWSIPVFNHEFLTFNEDYRLTVSVSGYFSKGWHCKLDTINIYSLYFNDIIKFCLSTNGHPQGKMVVKKDTCQDRVCFHSRGWSSWFKHLIMMWKGALCIRGSAVKQCWCLTLLKLPENEFVHPKFFFPELNIKSCLGIAD